MMDNEQVSFQKTVNGITVHIKGIARTQCCGNNLRGNPSITISSAFQINGVASILLIWTSLTNGIFEFPPKILRIGTIPCAFVPLNTETKLRRLKFPSTFGEIKKVIESTLGIKIKDAKIHENEYKQNYGFRIQVQDTVIDCEKLFSLSHTKDLVSSSKQKKLRNQQTEPKEELTTMKIEEEIHLPDIFEQSNQ